MARDRASWGSLIATFVVGLVVFPAAIYFLFSYYLDGLEDQLGKVMPTVTPSEAPPSIAPGNKPEISLREFDLIRHGMSYNQVVTIVGAKGKLLTQTERADPKSKTYLFRGGPGRNAVVEFYANKVIAKSEYKLKDTK